MPILALLYEPIAADMEKVCRIFDDELRSDQPVVNELCDHVRRYRGKMLRPALVLLSGQACGELNDVHHRLAAVVEMVHMATLVHDDVLDDGDLRRGRSTINYLQGNEAALLLGDYLLSHAFHLCSSIEEQYACRTIAATAHTLCAGELMQVHDRGNVELTVEQYYAIIRRKTASLTSVCCRLGALASGAEENVIDRLADYGEKIGIAFQITDDVLDLVGNEERMGKSLGRDLDKKKLTLPLIHALQEAEPALREQLRRSLVDEELQRDSIRGILDRSGSLTYALQAACDYVDAAISGLSAVPATDSREILIRMARMIVDRDA